MTHTRWMIRSLAILPALALAVACSSEDAVHEDAGKREMEAAKVVKASNTPAAQLLAAINRVRAQRGLRPLAPDDRLAAAAAEHATDMADHDFFDHKGSDGSNFASRVTRQGYAYRFVGENIAAGLESPDETVESWLASPDHRRNVLASDAIQAGIGYAYRPNDDGKADYRYYWVLTVGCAAAPRGQPQPDCAK